ncbi:MAG: DUF3090 family protein [Candidatus Limnocylindrales bacterium]|jgi:uncharacterized repeat protein (TIGR03847 family)
MARRVFMFENPDRFVAGAVGQPGSRTFYLQAREGTRLVTVALEKVQVALLAERLAELLAEVRSRGADVPQEPPADEVDRAPLEEPVVETFRVGTMTIVWDGDDESVVVEAREITEDEDEDQGTDEASAEDSNEDSDEDSDLVRVHLEPRKALAFATRALEVVAAGRPPCPFCGQPLNPEGHICVRRNGYMH